ncbi:hypothetical protein [Spiroplasma turonicum]|uniref:Transmembrane protein n=1 Tax=Spiroplasma turonicum TaxID=216946 RepID=A0A0K1P599_9MOLU|nr:hypothetical protein [Spiroplasma turonicum]AKU79465.1 hypothetical protein STURON_00219 [Spiroplasma turonicum]ALX70487.1 hypothetical protein STURO_v1c02180 [Spiroplasma turonicum]
MDLSVKIALASCIFIGSNTIITFLTLVILPIFVKKYNDKKQRTDAGENELTDAFDKYFSDEYSKNDLDWYIAEVRSIILKFQINHIKCLNCKRVYKPENYMKYFSTAKKRLPEVNNFSLKASRLFWKNELTVIYCKKCDGAEKVLDK